MFKKATYTKNCNTGADYTGPWSTFTLKLPYFEPAIKKRVFIFEKPSDNNRAQHPYEPLLSDVAPEKC